MQSKRAISHCFRHSSELIDGFAFRRQGNQRICDLGVRDISTDKALKELCGLAAVEIFTIDETQCCFAQINVTGVARERSFGSFWICGS
jgi:hypothetical protein